MRGNTSEDDYSFMLEVLSMKRSSPLSMLRWVWSAIAAFTALSVIIPIFWDRRARRARREER